MASIDANSAPISVKQEELDVGLSSVASCQGNGASQLPNGCASGTPPDNTVPCEQLPSCKPQTNHRLSDDNAATGLALLAEVVSTMPNSPGPMTSSIGSLLLPFLVLLIRLISFHSTDHTRPDVVNDANMTTEVQGKFHSASAAASLVAPLC